MSLFLGEGGHPKYEEKAVVVKIYGGASALLLGAQGEIEMGIKTFCVCGVTV